MAIPKKFVREHQLDEYRGAVLRDPRRPNDNTHLVMYSNWQRIMDEVGIFMGKKLGKKLTFEIVEEKSVPGDKVHFEVC
ncbi:hypothetical protein Hanom_Chr08g00728351 [Helianthus anomalus]